MASQTENILCFMSQPYTLIHTVLVKAGQEVHCQEALRAEVLVRNTIITKEGHPGEMIPPIALCMWVGCLPVQMRGVSESFFKSSAQ